MLACIYFLLLTKIRSVKTCKKTVNFLKNVGSQGFQLLMLYCTVAKKQ